MRPIQALLLAALAAACNVVTSDEPLGTHTLTLDPAAWDGTWMHAEGTVHRDWAFARSWLARS